MKREKNYKRNNGENIILQMQKEDENGENNSLTDIIILDIEDNIDETILDKDDI